MKLSSLEQFSRLVKDYVARFSNAPVQGYFPHPPGVFDAKFGEFAARRAAEFNRDPARRATLVTLLRSQHDSLGTLNDAVEANLAQLAKPNTVAIVTGQQVGLFGGPLYSLFKTVTTLELCKKLSAQHAPTVFVPVFWLETEDHDIEETRSTMVLDKDVSVAAIRYEPAGLPDPLVEGNRVWRKQVGPLRIEAAAITKTFEELRAALPPTEFTNELVAELERCYNPNETFGSAFAKLLDHYFGDEGLLVLDANVPVAKALGQELFTKELTTAPALSEQIIRQSVKLEEHYHAQVKPRALNLFLIEGGERFALAEKEGGAKDADPVYFLQGSKRTYTRSELLEMAASTPERFSPNVVLRPLYQDTLLPTAIYVGGPGEIAYFAQFRAAYEWAGIPMPMIAPRLSATLIHERAETLLAKYDLNPEEILIHGREAVRQFLESLSDASLAPQFEEAMATIERSIEGLRPSVSATDQTLSDALTTLKGKLVTQVRDFLGKTLGADRKRHANVKAQFEKVLSFLLPHDELQERELSLLFFLNKYGPNFWHELRTALSDGATQLDNHELLYLSKFHRNMGGAASPKKDELERTSDATGSLVAIPAKETA